jgi:hypothetical protein
VAHCPEHVCSASGQTGSGKKSVKAKYTAAFAPRCLYVCGTKGIAPHISKLGTTWRCEVSFMLQPHYYRIMSVWYIMGRNIAECLESISTLWRTEISARVENQTPIAS